jgi:malonate transporter
VIVGSVVPLFAVILLGWLAGRLRILDGAGIRGLIAFVFNFGMPCLLFRMMATTDVGAIAEWGFLGAFFVVQMVMFALGALSGRLLFGLGFAELVIQGFGCFFANSVLLGLPLLLWLYGEAGGVPVLVLITFEVLLFSFVTLLLELARGERGATTIGLIARTARSVALNPIIMSTLAGVVVSLAGVVLPTLVDDTLAFLGKAAPPIALFALGATLSQRRLTGSLAPAGTMVALKLLVHPALVWLALGLVPDLDPLWRQAGTIIAAGPVGINVFVFAQHYQAAVETASSAILISTALAMITITGVLVLLQ